MTIYLIFVTGLIAFFTYMIYMPQKIRIVTIISYHNSPIAIRDIDSR